MKRLFSASILALTALVGSPAFAYLDVPIVGKLECTVNDGAKKYPAHARFFNGEYHFTINGHERWFRHDRHGHPTFWIEDGAASVWSFTRGKTSMDFFRVPGRKKIAGIVYTCRKV